MHVRRVLACALAHFAVAMLIATIAFGTDLDQLRSRSPVSRAAAAVHDVLWAPHDAALWVVPNGWLVRHRSVIPAALVLNSIAWGAALYGLWRMLHRRHGPRRPRSPTPDVPL
jgi:hypothetical protein